jgi:hypothetical protein
VITDRSGAIISGGSSQEFLARSDNRTGFLLQNLSAGDLWIRFNAQASGDSPSIKVPPGATFTSPECLKDQYAISICGATTGQTFTAMEW